jgi:hypothetical protein
MNFSRYPVPEPANALNISGWSVERIVICKRGGDRQKNDQDGRKKMHAQCLLWQPAHHLRIWPQQVFNPVTSVKTRATPVPRLWLITDPVMQ